MANLKQMMMDELLNNKLIQTSFVDVTEELIDTGLAKTEENIRAAAVDYLDEKGYRKTATNMDMAKKKILDCSEGYDTVIVMKDRVTETNIFEKASVTELRDAMDICELETLSSIYEKVERLADRKLEYKVHTLAEVHDEKERPSRGNITTNFVSLEEILNKYAKDGWELDTMYPEPKANNNAAPRTFLIFKRPKMK